MSRKHSSSLSILLRASSVLLALAFVAGCMNSPRRGLSFNPMPISKGQWVEYVNNDMPYEDYHVKFIILNVNANGILLETDYYTREETLKIVSFNNIANNYSIDTFIVQYNSQKAYKFVAPDGHFMFESPIPNLFIWSHQIDTMNWKTTICNNRQFNVFEVASGNDTVHYSDEIPVFNVARMFLHDQHLQVYNYGNKGGRTIISEKPEILITGKNLPESFKKILNLDMNQ